MALDIPTYLMAKGSGGGGGTSDYSQLTNKPSINGVTLSGDKSSADLGIETNYLGNSGDYTADNRLDITNLKEGIYTFKFTELPQCKVTINGATYNFAMIKSNVNDVLLNSLLYLVINYPITDDYPSSRYIGYFAYTYVNEYDRIIKTVQNLIQYTGSGISNNTTPSQNFNVITTGGTQTISSKKTFTTLPESSVVPTKDDQLVNKKYVDDNAGGGYLTLTFNHQGTYQFSDQDPNDLKGKLSAYINSCYANGLSSCPINVNVASGVWTGDNKINTTTMYNNVALFTKPTNFYFYEPAFPLGHGGVATGSYNGGFVGANLQVVGTWSGDTFTCSNIIFNSGEKGDSTVLSLRNTETYNPSSDYNPATKKYVDDNVLKQQNIMLAQANGIETYDNSKSYVIGDRVFSYDTTYRQGRFYQCKANSVGHYPPNSTYWEVITLSNDEGTLATKVDVSLTTITGYDATKTQVLKNVQGTLTWVDE